MSITLAETLVNVPHTELASRIDGTPTHPLPRVLHTHAYDTPSGPGPNAALEIPHAVQRYITYRPFYFLVFPPRFLHTSRSRTSHKGTSGVKFIKHQIRTDSQISQRERCVNSAASYDRQLFFLPALVVDQSPSSLLLQVLPQTNSFLLLRHAHTFRVRTQNLSHQSYVMAPRCERLWLYECHRNRARPRMCAPLTLCSYLYPPAHRLRASTKRTKTPDSRGGLQYHARKTDKPPPNKRNDFLIKGRASPHRPVYSWRKDPLGTPIRQAPGTCLRRQGS